MTRRRPSLGEEEEKKKRRGKRAEARSIRAVFLGGGAAGGDAEAGVLHLLEKSDRKSLIFPTHPPTTLCSQTAGVENTPSRPDPGSSNPGPCPHLIPAAAPSNPTSPRRSLSLSFAPLLIYVFAEQLLPREPRERHSHLSTLVTRCHLLLPAHRTSEQTMPCAF